MQNTNLIKAPPGFDFDHSLEEAQKLASNYAVAFVVDDKVIGSGTLVKVRGMYGILTAHHVAIVPSKKKGERSNICFRENAAHELKVTTSQFHHFVVGSSRNHLEHTGPDLSFLMITDPKVYSSLSSIKSFFPLDEEWQTAAYADKFPQMQWSICGCPEELTDTSQTLRGRHLVRCCCIHAEARFLSLRTRKDFDYIRLEVHSGIHEFPEKYGGVSGGGIGLPVGKMEKDKPTYLPLLKGVIFYQSRPYSKNRKRIIIGHGPESIYKRLVEAIS
jgi:hypothetical protein